MPDEGDLPKGLPNTGGILGFLAGMQSGIAPETREALAKFNRQIEAAGRLAGSFAEQLPDRIPIQPAEEKNEALALPPAVIGGEDKKPSARSRKSRSKVITVGGVRSVKYYYWTKHELEMLGTRRSEAARSFAIAAFAAGLVADGVKDLLLNPPAPGTTQKGIWIAFLIFAALAMLYYGWEGFQRTREAKSFLDEVKDEHDFAEG